MSPPPQRRTSRRSREELRRLLVETGTELLIEEGLGTGAEHLTFKRVFEHLESTAGIRVTNASVIGRIWDSQDDFQTELLSTIAWGNGNQELDATLQMIGQVLEGTDRSSLEARLRAVREICRLGGVANLDAVVSSSTWPPWIGVWALVMAGTDSEEKRPIEVALRARCEQVTETYEEVYDALTAYFGLRPRFPLTVHQFTVAIDAFAQGCALRDSVDSQSARRILRPTGPGGEDQEWTLFGIGLDAMVTEFFEPDPEWELG
jgi:hypothetical protein